MEPEKAGDDPYEVYEIVLRTNEFCWYFASMTWPVELLVLIVEDPQGFGSKSEADQIPRLDRGDGLVVGHVNLEDHLGRRCAGEKVKEYLTLLVPLCQGIYHGDDQKLTTSLFCG